MIVDVIDADPIIKKIEEEKGDVYKRVSLKDKQRALNANVKLIEENLIKLLSAVYPSYSLTVSDDQVERINNRDKKEFTSSHIKSISILNFDNENNEVEIDDLEQVEIWAVIIFFLSGVCSEPDSNEYPALPMNAPEINDDLMILILRFQADFIVLKAKTTTKLTKISRPVSVRFKENRIKVAGFWVETVLSKTERKSVPLILGKVTGYTLGLTKRILIVTKSNKKYSVDILDDSFVVNFFEKTLKYEDLYFKIDQLYTASNDSSYYELKGIFDNSSDIDLGEEKLPDDENDNIKN